MKEEKKVLSLEDEAGNEVELEVLKEFDYKDKKYAVLYEKDDCDCDDNCKCEDDCDCKCEDECDDDCECGCHEEEDYDGHVYILEVNKDSEGNTEYSEVDSKLMDELVAVAEKELYPTED